QAERMRELHYWLLAGRRDPPARLARRPGAAHRPRRRPVAPRVRDAAPGRAPGGRGRHERVRLPPPLPQRHLADPAAVPEAIAAAGSTAAATVARRDREPCRVCGGLRERAAVHAGVRADVRAATGKGRAHGNDGTGHLRWNNTNSTSSSTSRPPATTRNG